VTTEIRFAFALNGGVSLAIWIGGVVDEVLRFVSGGRTAAAGDDDPTNPYTALCASLGLVPKVDVLAGSSAGGLNAAFLGAAVVHGCSNMHPIKQLWLDHGSFDRLLRSPTDASLISVLNGDANFLPHIEAAFALLAENGTGYAAADPPVTVRLTATSLPGRVTTLSDDHGDITSVDHRGEFVFTTRDFDFDSDDRAIRRLARACRTTASFPGAFEPSSVAVDLYDDHHAIGLFEGVRTATVPVIDGAVLVNLPAQSAIDAIVRQPSRERIERVLALVVPDPGDFREGDGGDPSLNEVLSKSIVGIPRTQSLTDFVGDLNEHNLEVRSRRAARSAMLSQFAGIEPAEAWARLDGVAQSLFPAYRATRVATVLERVRLGLPALLPQAAPAIDQSAIDSIDADTVPWVPRALELGGRAWCWGASPVHRLSSVLITWINAAAADLDPDDAAGLYAMKADVSRARAAADRLAATDREFEATFAEELQRAGATLVDAFERASARWPVDDPQRRGDDIAALNDQLVALAGCLATLVDAARSASHNEALQGLVRLYEGASARDDVTRLLLCLEVVEATFSGNEPRPDQEIRLVQFTSKGAVTVDRLGRSAPMDKLAGVELAHFGAFLKRSWRANDWMWGRLDAAERLLTLVDTMVGGRLTREGTLAHHTRAVQLAVLREELPTVVAEIEADGKLGALVTTEARAFCDAVRKAAATPEGPVDLGSVDDDTLAELFTLERVGSENLEQEIGSDLARMTSIGALATTAAVLRAQGPRLLRAPVGVFGFSTSLAWKLAQRRRGRRLHLLAAVVIVTMGVLGLVGTAIDVFSSVDLGPWRYVALTFLVLAPMLAVVATPWLLLAGGRRLMGRQAVKAPAPSS
jgi:predicted acylesterase/phospholipase RssA